LCNTIGQLYNQSDHFVTMRVLKEKYIGDGGGMLTTKAMV